MGTIIFEIILIILNAGCLLFDKDNDKLAKCISVLAIITLCIALILRISRMG